MLAAFSAYSQNDSTHLFSSDIIIKSNTGKIQYDTLESKIPSGGQLIYELKPSVDIPIIAVGSAFSIYAFTKIYNKGASTEEQINNLKTSDINSFDRWALRPYSKSLDDFSYYPFYAVIPLPFVMFLMTDDMRHDYWKLSFLYVEALSVTGIFGAGGPLFIDRYRPYAYSAETTMDKRLGQNAKNSAFAGHVEVIAVSTFFIAKVYGDYYPDTRLVMYSLASLATGGMAYLRLAGGMHFPSDILIGAAIGSLSGILVPHFHKHGLIKNHDLGIIPYSNGDTYGLALTYKLKK